MIGHFHLSLLLSPSTLASSWIWTPFLSVLPSISMMSVCLLVVFALASPIPLSLFATLNLPYAGDQIANIYKYKCEEVQIKFYVNKVSK